MRRLPVLSLFVVALGAAGCVTHRADGSDRVQTTGDANRENLSGPVKAPLRDLNLLRTKIPDVLLAAMADPYARPSRRATCAELIALVRPLDDALGADLDAPSTDEDDLVQKGRESVLGAVAGVTTDVVPFRGWVRKLSGAERHDKLVQTAIGAGAVRRAYLKGLGEAKGCPPPATPSHELAGREVITQEFRPRYPTRPATETSESEEPAEPGTPAERPKAGPRK
jgi:hypothetical protein